MSMEENKTIVRRFEELFNEKQVDRADEFVAPDYIDHGALPGQAPGLDGAKQKWAMYIAAIPDLRVPIEDMVAEGDKVVVRWTVYCTILAEELGIDSTNVDDMAGSDNPVVLGVLGVENEFGKAMGLSNTFCAQIIKHVGNYAEIYNRNLGPDTPFNLPRGLNALYTDGGILYSLPFR